MASKDEAQRVASPGREGNIETDWTVADIKFESDDQEKPFDWECDPSVILHDQAAIAVYFNPFNELVIKQRDTLGGPEATLYVAPENIDAFLQGLSDRARPLKKPRLVSGGEA
jgi:hypothetical protein